MNPLAQNMMNLDFKPIKYVVVDDVPYQLQKADVTANNRFWSQWRYDAKLKADAASLNADPPPNTISRFLSLSREGERWYAYRLISRQSGALAPFTLSYVLKDRSKLLSYQCRAVAHICASIVNHGAACDGSDTGIGKTYHALAVARELSLVPGIICRVAGIDTWLYVCRYFGIKPLFVINWESAKTGRFKFVSRYTNKYDGSKLFRWNLPSNTLLIFDEAHMGSVDGSLNNGLWRAAKPYITLSLSATFADRPSRLRTLFHILGINDDKSFTQWLYQRSHYINRFNEIEGIAETADMKDINKRLFPHYGYRISYDDPDVAQYIPKAVIQTEIVSLSEKLRNEQNDLYDKMLDRVKFYKEKGLTAEAINADMRYRQAAELHKADVLADMAINYGMQCMSVLIFVSFRETLFYLAKRLKTGSLIYGNQKENRKSIIDDFQNDRCRILLSMVSAGGQSISLHDVRGQYRRISLITPTYSPVDIRQVIGRTYRSNSKSKPIIKLVYAAGTVEEKVSRLVNRKLANISALHDGDLMEPDLFGLIKSEVRSSHFE